MSTVNAEQGILTVVAGTKATNIRAGHNVLMHIFVKAATAGTTFDVQLTDIYSNNIFLREDITGELNELLQMPTTGNYTLTILNSSADENFKYMLAFKEN